MREAHRDIATFVSAHAPDAPVHVIYPEVLAETARTAVASFPGDVLYAVKCNDHPMVLQALYQGGVRHFDTASIAEIKQIRALFPDAECHFMHPVKPAAAIADAFHTHHVKAFALDHADELAKIDAAIGPTERGGVMLAVRVEMPRGQAAIDLTGKFGAPLDEAAQLLADVHHLGYRTGLTFHVGSYCTNPGAFREAIEICRRVQAMAGVPLDVLDVGGGFPAAYTGKEGVFRDYVEEIAAAVRDLDFAGPAALRCEPGRGLVGEGQSILTQVDLRRRDDLFINDGVFGGLSELKWLGPYFPIQVLRRAEADTVHTVGGAAGGFQLFGPTCDSIDSCPGPFEISDAVKTGDWLEIGKVGAYSNAYRTRFNGFHSDRYIYVAGRPFWADNAVSEQTEADITARAAA